MSCRGKGETNGGLIAEFEETTGMKGMSKLTRHSTRISPIELNSRSLCIKFSLWMHLLGLFLCLMVILSFKFIGLAQ